MEIANKLELHYYFSDPSHEIDAVVRNKCEAEILAIISEIASVLDIDANLVAEAVKEGGVRDFWKILGENIGPITVVLLVAQLLITATPILLDSEKEELEKELHRLQIEETKLNIEKLRKEVKESTPNDETARKAANHLSKNLKIIKRKSNFYSVLNTYPKVSNVGLSVLKPDSSPLNEEKSIARSDFRKFILGSNKLKAEEVEAEIEIVSPVLKEGRFKWKGFYNGLPISFEMLDTAFKDAVLLDNIPFRHGSKIICALRIDRELDEVGDVKITGYAATTVIEKIDSDATYETLQGKKYRHGKKFMEDQHNLFT